MPKYTLKTTKTTLPFAGFRRKMGILGGGHERHRYRRRGQNRLDDRGAAGRFGDYAVTVVDRRSSNWTGSKRPRRSRKIAADITQGDTLRKFCRANSRC
jgi:hypothetical protein